MVYSKGDLHFYLHSTICRMLHINELPCMHRMTTEHSPLSYSLAEVYVWFVYVHICNISHCGCNLSHKFLIHSLYLPKSEDTVNVTVFLHVTPPRLDIPPSWSHVSSYPHSSIHLPPLPPHNAPHAVPAPGF